MQGLSGCQAPSVLACLRGARRLVAAVSFLRDLGELAVLAFVVLRFVGLVGLVVIRVSPFEWVDASTSIVREVARVVRKRARSRQILATRSDGRPKTAAMHVEIEPWGGIVVRWERLQLWLLVDVCAQDAWVVWRGRPLGRVPIGAA